jgi:hypothetical protein
VWSRVETIEVGLAAAAMNRMLGFGRPTILVSLQ